MAEFAPTPQAATVPVWRKGLVVVLGTIGIVAGVVLSRELIRPWLQPGPEPRPKEQTPEKPLEPSVPSSEPSVPPREVGLAPPPREVPTPEELAVPHLEKARKECEQARQECIRGLVHFFQECKQNSRAFAEHALGWGSKRRFIQDLLPWGKRDRLEEHICQLFGEYFFTPEYLQKVIDQQLKLYAQQVQDAENKMLVALQADIAEWAEVYPISGWEPNRLQQEFHRVLIAVYKEHNKELKIDLDEISGGIVASEIIMLIIRQVGVRLGLLSARGLSGVASLGIGLVVGIVVDYILHLIYDTAGQLAEEVNKQLDEMCRQLIDGYRDSQDPSQSVKGLRALLEDFEAERARFREAAVLSLMRHPEGK